MLCFYNVYPDIPFCFDLESKLHECCALIHNDLPCAFIFNLLKSVSGIFNSRTTQASQGLPVYKALEEPSLPKASSSSVA
jgi:hypothetical protein